MLAVHFNLKIKSSRLGLTRVCVRVRVFCVCCVCTCVRVRMRVLCVCVCYPCAWARVLCVCMCCVYRVNPFPPNTHTRG